MSVRRGSLADDIAAHVRGRILSGDMKPGEKVDQELLASELGVSRSPIREALVVLGQEGLLDVTPRRGVFVARLTREDVVDHYELFGLISGRVAAQAARDLTDEQLGELHAIHDRFEAATGDEHGALNHEYHQLINTAASRRTRWLLRHLERSIPASFYGNTPGWDQEAVVGHGEITKAILARDEDAARDAMEKHLHDAGLAAVAALEVTGFWDAVVEDDAAVEEGE